MGVERRPDRRLPVSAPWPLPAPEDAYGPTRLDDHIAERLFTQRQLMLHGPLDTDRATRLAAQLMTLEADGLDPITLSVNSTGGELPALFSVTDTMHAMHASVDTRCLGQARGSAVALVGGGPRRPMGTRPGQVRRGLANN
jgi:ATP-dependent Clp protease, protease subunit